MPKSLIVDQFQLGVCYYPEHWPEEMWADDFTRMKACGFSVIRVAEFAWALFEPVEGEFHFELFDRALDLAHSHGLKVILGTPTATPPAWLTHKHPEVLNASFNGELYRHGQRRHYNYSSPVYRRYCEIITRKMAEHFRDHPAVIGWQIDNELNCETNVFYSDADHVAFREWTKRKYGTLDALNQAWGTVFWSQTYTDWEQVFLTRPTPSDSPNPHHALDEKRFFSDNAIEFSSLQNDILREVCPHHWVTTNGLFGHLDNHRLTEEQLDFISYDSYPMFGRTFPDQGVHPFLDRKSSFNLTGVRGISPNFCIMEQQSGPGGWVNRIEQPSPKPGQTRLWTYQSVAHGADMILYFRWRTATVGTEIYWHGINDYHNRPNRRVEEITRIGTELASIGATVAGTRYQADVALLRDYANDWDGEMDVWHGRMQWPSTLSWFKTFQNHHVPMDVVTVKEDLALEELQRYKTLIYPHPAILTEKTAQLLEQYVENGGTLVFGARTGYKNEHGHCYMMPFPGYASKLCGISVEDFTLVDKLGVAPLIRWKEKGVQAEVRAEYFNDILHPESEGLEVLGWYDGDYYKGKPAFTRNRVGLGSVYYYGAMFTEEAAEAVYSHLGIESPLRGLCELPRKVEAAIRVNEMTGDRLLFLLNYDAEPAAFTLHREATDLLGGGTLIGSSELEPYGVLVLKL